MSESPYADILHEEGFEQIGQLHHRLYLTVWWHPASDKLLQILVLSVGESALLKADKAYHLQSVSSEGETWTRDIAALHDYLESHFPELRIAFSHFRDVPGDLALTEIRHHMSVEAPTNSMPTVEEVAELQEQLHSKQRELETSERMAALLHGDGDLLSGYLHQQHRTRHARIDELQDTIKRKTERLGFLQHLQREYQLKGSAAVYTFSINSNLQVVENAKQFRDALQAVVKELMDMHRYQVMQKLGGRLNIQVTEANQPAIAWIEQWLGGALSPMQMRRLPSELSALRQLAEQPIMVTPDEPIMMADHVRHAEKHLAARVLSTIVQRLDKTDLAAKPRRSAEADPEAIPLSLGRRLDDAGRVVEPATFPLAEMVHIYISGTTGSGKSFLARVLVEEAAQCAALNILVLDPRNQSIGLLVPEDRPKILTQYEGFGIKAERAHGFGFRYFAPALPYASPLPPQLSALSTGRSIVSFKGLDDSRRCALAGAILDAVFEACNASESERPRLLVLVDEAQLFTRKRLEESARGAAGQVERALDRIAREGRKFGIVLALVSQTMKDFAYELASIRQMTTTKIFLRNSDREIDYAADVLGDGRQLVHLPTGTALVHNANWGVARIRVRPPFSKVFELGEAEIRRLIRRDADRSMVVSLRAQELLHLIKDNEPDEPLNMSQLGVLAGISSKRRLQELVDELEQAGAIRTRKLVERGRPRVIELTKLPGSADPAAA